MLPLATVLAVCFAQVPDLSGSASGVQAAESGDGGDSLVPEGQAETESAAISPEFLDELIEKLANDALTEGEGHLRRGALPAALSSFKEAHAMRPSGRSSANMAFVYHRLDSLERAEELYRDALGDDFTLLTALNFSDLLIRRSGQGNLQEAWTVLERCRENFGNDPGVVRRQVRLATLRGDLKWAEQAYGRLLGFPPTDVGRLGPAGIDALGAGGSSLTLELGDFFRDTDRWALALQWYRRVPSGTVEYASAQERMRGLEVERDAAALGWIEPLVSDSARRLLDLGRASLTAGKLTQAEALLRRAVSLSPRFMEARVTLGDALEAQDDQTGAERVWLRALALDGGHGAVLSRLGRLLLRRARLAEGSEGAADSADAAVLLLRATRLFPQDADLLWSLAQAQRMTGDLAGTRGTLRQYLASNPDAVGKRRARSLLEALEELDGVPGRMEIAPIETRERLARARALVAHGDLGAAIKELAGAGGDPRSPAALNFEARIYRAADHPERSAEAFRTSLALESNQPAVWGEFGDVLLLLGKTAPAREAYNSGLRLGWAPGIARLAAMEWGSDGVGFLTALSKDPRRGWRRWRDFDRWVLAEPGLANESHAMRLHGAVRAHLRSLKYGGGLILLLLVMLIFVGIWRRRRGLTLKELVQVRPELAGPVGQILAALRHEVLKHNTLALDALLEGSGAPAGGLGTHSAEHLEHIHRSLFGTDGKGGAKARMIHYGNELGRIARSHGLLLNLDTKDPVFHSLKRGFNRLQRLLPRTGGGDLHSLSGRALRQVRQAASALNQTAPTAIREVENAIRGNPVDRQRLETVFERLASEGALASTPVKPIQWVSAAAEGASARVAIPLAELDDVLINLMRNALVADLVGGERTPGVGLALRTECHRVTGQERVCVTVYDASLAPFSNQDIYDAPQHSGLGIARSIVRRHGGTLVVEPGTSGWAKGVVAKVPLLEIPQDRVNP